MIKRWAAAGAALGVAVVLLTCAPASWLAGAVSDATGERLQLADTRGTVWSGSAVMMLTGGIGSRTASVLPGRLHWTLGLDGAALGLRARQACCINGEIKLRLQPGFGRLRVDLTSDQARPAAQPGGVPSAAAVGQWPASWLVGLGTPWNTLQPSGSLQLITPGITVEQVQGRWLFSGMAVLEMASMASRMSTLDVLGSYRLSLIGDAAKNQTPRLQLSTSSGALLLSGDGEFGAAGTSAKLRFNGSASAAPGSEAALDGLLNLVGRRQGAVSLISIG